MQNMYSIKFATRAKGGVTTVMVHADSPIHALEIATDYPKFSMSEFIGIE
jgi:hypothetical protein